MDEKSVYTRSLKKSIISFIQNVKKLAHQGTNSSKEMTALPSSSVALMISPARVCDGYERIARIVKESKNQNKSIRKVFVSNII